MFRLKNKKRREVLKKDGVTLVGVGCSFTGSLHCQGTSRIGGDVEGEIISQGSLVIEEEAQIKASIESDHVIVCGEVEGSLIAAHEVLLTATSRFTGSITSPSLVIEKGAFFNGTSSTKLPAAGVSDLILKKEATEVKSTPILMQEEQQASF